MEYNKNSITIPANLTPDEAMFLDVAIMMGNSPEKEIAYFFSSAPFMIPPGDPNNIVISNRHT